MAEPEPKPKPKARPFGSSPEDQELERQLRRVVEQRHRGILTADESDEKCATVLYEWLGRDSFRGRPLPDAPAIPTFYIQLAVAYLCIPAVTATSIAALELGFVPPIPPVAIQLEERNGWKAFPVTDRPAASWLAVVRIEPPQRDAVVGLAAIASANPELRYPLTGRLTTPTPYSEPSVVPDGRFAVDLSGGSSFLLAARTVPDLRAAAERVMVPVSSDDVAARVQAVLDSALDDVKWNLLNRRGWRHKHPVFGSTTPSLALLRHLPRHWSPAEHPGAPTEAEVSAFCDAVKEWDPLSGSRSDEGSTTKWNEDTRVIEQAERWRVARGMEPSET